MMEQIQLFNYENHEVRTIQKDGEIWFVSRDLEQITGHKNIRNTINVVLDLDEVNSVVIGDDKNSKNTFQIINESGLYKLLFRSKLPQAKAFTKYVTSVILPTIRKTGSFSANSNQLREIANDKNELQTLTDQKSKINKRLRFLRLRIEDNEKLLFSPYVEGIKKMPHQNQNQLTIFE